MKDLKDLITQFIELNAALKEEKAEIEAKLGEINRLLSGNVPPPFSSLMAQVPTPFARKRRGMSAAGRARIIAAQKARWTKVHAERGAVKAPPIIGRRRMSAAGRARIAAAARARWAKAKRAGKNSL
jgi:hypothetical protein